MTEPARHDAASAGSTDVCTNDPPSMKQPATTPQLLQSHADPCSRRGWQELHRLAQEALEAEADDFWAAGGASVALTYVGALAQEQQAAAGFDPLGPGTAEADDV